MSGIRTMKVLPSPRRCPPGSRRDASGPRFRDRESEAGTSGLPGPRLVHAVKRSKTLFLKFRRDPDPGICHFQIEELMVSIQRYPDPAIFFVILDRILHKIVYRQWRTSPHRYPP